MELLNWSEFDVTTTTVGGSWRLTVENLSGGPSIIGDGGNTIPLDAVYIRATCPDATTPIIDGGWVALSNIASNILENGTTNLSSKIIVSYRCGMAPAVSISNASTDHYYVDLLFKLVYVP